ncbi:trans-sialidase [Trypanosoma rangeli]|uniref:Trans-sialidase n=1 Tax=Trypanosoma rangeli TaxID=5698 RepID=A0A3R7KA99_TRYRA|nr:trans-sialidase [Trypanosoma rangeli]RNE96688.1 trans-sialidase [Trypanosoma rangeli]|eukprot:RNE96688.1 trans-sialidase [Trypanosoma rangeli]
MSSMPRHLFSSALLFLPLCMLSMCFCSAVVVTAKSNSNVAINPFDSTTNVSGAKWKEIGEAGASVTSLRLRSLVRVGEHVFAVAEAQCKKKEGSEEASSFAGIASVLLHQISDSAKEIPTTDASLFCMQLEETNDVAGSNAPEIVQPTTIVRGGDVYMLLGKYSRARSESEVSGKNGWKLLLVKGAVSGTNDEEKRIQWGETHAVQIESETHGSLTRLVGSGGSGLVLSDGTLVFPMQATNNEGKNVLLSMRFTPSEKKWELSQDTAGEDCKDPSIVEWGEDQKLLMMAPCERGSYDVYESTRAGTSWYANGAPISRVWGNSRDRKRDGVRSSFTTAEVEETEVMLLTTPVYSEEKGEGRLHLWMTDNARVHDVGPVSREGDDAAASSLLYGADKKELILQYEKKNGDSYSLVAVNLTGTLKQIKSVVKAWKEKDNALLACKTAGSPNPRTVKGVCNGSIPIKGLVGFLSGKSADSKTWEDEYLGVNATATNGKLANDGWGATFEDAGAGAEWPVGKLGQNQPYYFANNKFTLVAAVMIHEVPEEANALLLSADLEDNESTTFVGLSYTTKKLWGTVFNGITTIHNSTWEPGREYKVAIMLQDNKGFVYVDGVLVGSSDTLPTREARRHDISHFYFGDSEDSSATVKNAFLYNRPLSEQELKTVDDSNASEQSTSDSSTRADGFRVLILLLGLWGLAVLC